METSLDKGIQGKEAKKVLPTLHKTPPNGTIGGVFVCGGKSLNPGPRGVCGPNHDKEVFANMADETKTNATPEAPGGPPPPAPEQTEQAVIPSMDGGLGPQHMCTAIRIPGRSGCMTTHYITCSMTSRTRR